ncbi:MAG: VWA domain-containing protein [Acidobacteria bacterium]|nr:VWA domain-containing protein [Acidobacteriota bacterium]
MVVNTILRRRGGSTKPATAANLMAAPRRCTTRLAFVLTLICSLVAATFSQIVLRSDLVLIPVTVRDKQGKYIADLQVEDFNLFDNGKPQPIAFFSSERDPDRMARPLALALLLDASRSISAVLHQQQSAVTSFLNHLGDQTLVSLISFSQNQETLLGFTTDKTEALNAFFRHRRLGGETAIFDALAFALKSLNALSEGERRKIVVIVSDGLDTASRISYQDCARLAQEQGIAVYSILIPIYSPYGDRLVARRPTKGFIEIAEETGGKFFQVGTLEDALNPRAKLDLGPVFEAIVEDLRHQYYLGFYPPEDNHPGFHRIEVRVARKNMKLELRRRGYTIRSIP